MPAARDVVPGAHPADALDAESSLRLLERLRGGDVAAREVLMARYLPRLHRWAHGRLPSWARDIAETQDLVQDTVARAIHHLDRFSPHGDGGFGAYMRTALLNRVREETRRAGRRPLGSPIDHAHVDLAPSPLSAAIDAQSLQRYREALARLRPEDQDAIVMRLELGFSFEEIARAQERPNANAARSAVNRAILRLAAALRHD